MRWKTVLVGRNRSGQALLAALRALDPDELREVAQLLAPYLTSADSNWLTVDEAARYARVSPSTIRQAVRSGMLVAAQAARGHKISIKRSELDRWRAARSGYGSSQIARSRSRLR